MSTTDGRLPAPENISSPAHRHAADRLVYPPAAGSITSPFAPANLPRSAHPALDAGNAGGHVANVTRVIAEAAGGKLTRG
jgi:hypothetical protein